MDARHNVNLRVEGGEVIGYLAEPESSHRSLVIVLHEWMGLSEHARGVCDNLAGEGYLAFAPDLYGGETPADSTEASAMMGALPVQQVVSDVVTAIYSLLKRSDDADTKVGVIGFSMGAAVLFNLASRYPELVSAAVPYYGGPFYEVDLSRISTPILGHFGEADPWAGAEVVDQLRRGLTSSDGAVDLRMHDGAQHGFVVEGNPAYDPQLSEDTWFATLDFLRTHLG